jgi:xylulokinase
MGIKAGIPVVAGGHDHLCAALAAGLVKERQLLDSSGTAQAILALTPRFQPTRELFQSAFTHYPHVVENQYVVQGGAPAAGGAIEWFARLLTGGVGSVPVGAYAALFTEAAAVPPGAGGVLCVPHLLGSGTPQNDQVSRGTLLGLSMDHTRGHVFRSVIEALGYSLRENVEAVEAALSERIDEVISVGGANRAELTLQIKADVTGRTITAPQLEEATATGAALLAGVGAGVYADVREAAYSLNVPSRSYAPNSNALATYTQRYHSVYLKLHRALEDVNRELSS